MVRNPASIALTFTVISFALCTACAFAPEAASLGLLISAIVAGAAAVATVALADRLARR